ncbi:unnamed protein product [Debaryomyces tyrocola]|nr:unnamed protein product [Debaryomyces tyrocola]
MSTKRINKELADLGSDSKVGDRTHRAI